MTTSNGGMPSDPIDAFPRLALGHWPTPLQPCRRLQAEVGGPLVWLKRDDCSGLALGGNKTRKLEFLLGDANDQNATGVITFGALQSNHARQTAAACVMAGLPCDLILVRAVDRDTVHYRTSGNRMLDDVLGATVHVVDDEVAATERAAELTAEDPGRYIVDIGGSSAIGALGYVVAAGELVGQLRDLGIDAARLVVAGSTGGTAAGLVVGLDREGSSAVVHVTAVHRGADRTRRSIDALVTATSELLARAAPPPERLVVSDRALGPGYGIETSSSHAAIELLARTEGVLLDPVYTAKAFAELLDDRTGDPDDHVVFVHTGGQAGLFAYADAFISTG